MQIITNFNTLKALEKTGLIKLHKDTSIFKYIEEAPHTFTHNGQTYKTIYLDGCFYPFIYKLN
jgi:hypothetical protein